MPEAFSSIKNPFSTPLLHDQIFVHVVEISGLLINTRSDTLFLHALLFC